MTWDHLVIAIDTRSWMLKPASKACLELVSEYILRKIIFSLKIYIWFYVGLTNFFSHHNIAKHAC